MGESNCSGKCGFGNSFPDKFYLAEAVTGHVNGKEGITLNFFDRIKTEIAAALIIGGMLLAIMLPISGLSLPGDLSYGYTEEGLYISSAYGFEERFLRWY